MEDNVGGSHKFYGAGTSKSAEWDLNEWKWDGHQFLATPLSTAPSDCRNKQVVPLPVLNGSSSWSEEADLGVVMKGKGELDKRKRVLHAGDDGGLCEEDGSLSLKLGGCNLPVQSDARNGGKRGSCSRSVCQVEACGADLSDAKDYHRRHKVCEVHAKACRAMVGNAMQRFCQQCSRFHLLQEFDEGKRSCRRRLAGHNKRRRKTLPDAACSGISLTNDHTNSYLLISLLKVLTDLHYDRSDKLKDQDLLSHLLGDIASLAGLSDSGNLSGPLQPSQNLHAPETSAGTPTEAGNVVPSNGFTAKGPPWPMCAPSRTCVTDIQGSSLRSCDHSVVRTVAKLEMSSRLNTTEASLGENVQATSSSRYPTLLTTESVSYPLAEDICSFPPVLPTNSTADRVRKDFDLNCTYTDVQDRERVLDQPAGTYPGNGSPNCPSWMLQDSHHASPPQASGNSDSTSAKSLSSSNGDEQSRTDRIVFKLFGKDPNDFPPLLRTQILNWLSHSPTDMESYIRPGCIVLTVYLCLPDSIWEELRRDLCYSLNRLLCTTGDDFWRKGWVFARIQHHVSFIYNGYVVVDSPLLMDCQNYCNITSVTPIAVAISARADFTVKGQNLAHSTARLLCAFEGKYLVTEATPFLAEDNSASGMSDEYQSLNFSCSIPNATGRGFIEVEDNGLTIGFFPFIVAEQDVCSEIRMLENSINVSTCNDILQGTSASQAMNFLNEIGWLLQRSHLKARSEEVKFGQGLFSLKRFRWLMTFSLDHEWCAVVKKLLNILFEGNVDLGERTPSELALSEDLLHVAVRKNSKSMVKFLLRYKPDAASEEMGPHTFLFRPDMLGPSNITPLHIAATTNGAEDVLDALIDDPGQLGLKVWKYARDSTGFTPEDYALSKGYQSYILLVQRKLNNCLEEGQVVLNIPGVLASDSSLGQLERSRTSKVTSFDVENSRLSPTSQPSCLLCDRQQLACRSTVGRSLLYRPAMLSMVGIAAVCVCVGLLFKGPPEVIYVCPPFRWETLRYGYM